jgi:hypothetical protein
MSIKKRFFAVAGSLAFLMLSGCGGGVKEVAFACVFPDAPNTEAPGWICDEPVEGITVSAVGTAAKSSAGLSFMKNMASTDARVQLAQSMKVHVQNMVKQYAEATGAADSETVDRVNTSVTKQITDETLVGTKVFKTRTSPNGTLYVLLGVDAASAAQATQNAVNSSMKNENALWQQFKAKGGQGELADAIANQ